MKKTVICLCAAVVIVLAGSRFIDLRRTEPVKSEQPPDGSHMETPEQSTADDVRESVADAGEKIDFAALQKQNPDIFAWLRVPGTNIDYPVLQSPVQDDYYKRRGLEKQPDPEGCLYTEMANLVNMCDFNTVIHGSINDKRTMFSELRKFENPDFFAEQELFYIYLPDNRLTYKILASFPYTGGDILRTYDLTGPEGCDQFLEDIYQTREMGMNFREGFERPTPYNFLVSLLAEPEGEEETPYLVIGVLTDDESGTIDRLVY